MRTARIGKRKSAAVVATLACAAGLMVAAGPAQAAPARPDRVINHSCGPAINVNQTTNRHSKDSSAIGSNAWTSLEYGSRSGYGKVYWAHIWHAPKNSHVWLDWSDDGKHNWHQCGPYRVDGSQGSHDRWTWAVNGQALARLAAQHEEIIRLREAAAGTARVSHPAPRTTVIGSCS
ncbi:hypothetical protein ACWD4B_12430 [Streptomyces sp. NPDC002536]